MDTRPDDLPLAAALAGLPPEQRDALVNRTRRHILRRLNEAADSQSPADLALQLGASISSAHYHVRVLSACGLIELASTRPTRGTTENRFASAAADSRGVCLILAATAAADDNGGP